MTKAAQAPKAAVVPVKGQPNLATGQTPIQQLNAKYSGESRQDSSLAAMKRTESGAIFAEGLEQGNISNRNNLQQLTNPDNAYARSKIADEALGNYSKRAGIDADATFKSKTGMDPGQAEMWRGREFNKSVNESNNARAAENAVTEEKLAISRQQRLGDRMGGGGGGGGAPSSNGGNRSGGSSGGGNAGREYASRYNEMEAVQAELARSSAYSQSVSAAKELYSGRR